MADSEDAARPLPITLLACDDEAPLVRLKPGMQIEVSTVRVASLPDLEDIAGGSRLCGGSGTCLAIIDKRLWAVNPAP